MTSISEFCVCRSEAVRQLPKVRLSDGMRRSSVLIVAIPLLVLLTLAGFIMTLIGGVGWALQAPIRRLVWFGVAQERVKRIVPGNGGKAMEAIP